MSRLSTALASLIQDLREPHGRLHTLENRRNDDPGDFRTLESHDTQQSLSLAPPPSQKSGHQPPRDEVLNYLGRLADDYHLPRKLVYAVADAESRFNVSLESPNYLRDKHHKIVHDKSGNPVVKSWDYGLMQINGDDISHVDSHGRQRGIVKDPQGRPFKITDEIKTDWRANARAGVALLAPAYHLAVLEQGPGATAEDNAQQAYSQYNSGIAVERERYLKQAPNGSPTHGADRNFLDRYRATPDKPQ
jgi:hypothetical protein